MLAVSDLNARHISPSVIYRLSDRYTVMVLIIFGDFRDSSSHAHDMKHGTPFARFIAELIIYQNILDN